MTYLPFNKKTFSLTLLSLALSTYLFGSFGPSTSFAADCLWEFNDQIADAQAEATEGYHFCRGEAHAIAWRCHHENGTRYERAVDDAIKDYEDCVRRG